jgi:hypothetical protein
MTLYASLRNGRNRARLLRANDAERAMANPGNSGDRDERRRNLVKLLDRLDAVHPRCMPELIVGQWLRGDADAQRKIEEAIDGMPRKPI